MIVIKEVQAAMKKKGKGTQLRLMAQKKAIGKCNNGSCNFAVLLSSPVFFIYVTCYSYMYTLHTILILLKLII